MLGVERLPGESERSEQGFKILPATTVTEILGGDNVQEPQDLGLKNKPLQILFQTHPDGSTEFVVGLQYGLKGINFLRFLTQASPYKLFSSIDGVVGDWVLPDRRDSYAKELVDKHLSLGENWEQFAAHRLKFLRAIQNEGELLSRLTVGKVMREEGVSEAEKRFKNGKISRNVLRKMLFFEGLEETRAEFAEHVRTNRKFREIVGNTSRHMTPDAIINRLFFVSNEKRKRVIKDALRGLDPQTRVNFLSKLRLAQHSDLTVVALNGQGKEKVYVRLQRPDTNGGARIVGWDQEKVTLRSSNQEAYGLLKLGVEGKVEAVVLPETVVDIGGSVLPVLHWSSKEDKEERKTQRQWIDSVSQDAIANLLQSFNMPSGQKEILDSLAGLLSVAYFSPEIVSRWKDHLPLKSGGHGQFMGPAQIPVLAYMFRHLLLDSRFIKAMEQYVQNRV